MMRMYNYAIATQHNNTDKSANVDIYGIPSIFLLSSSHRMLVDMLIASGMQSTKVVTADVLNRQSETSD